MGEMSEKLTLIRNRLAETNLDAPSADIAMYADSYMEYQEAIENIRANGTIVFHPRTGAPIENPYSAVKKRAMDAMRSIRTVVAPDDLWGWCVPAKTAPAPKKAKRRP